VFGGMGPQFPAEGKNSAKKRPCFINTSPEVNIRTFEPCRRFGRPHSLNGAGFGVREKLRSRAFAPYNFYDDGGARADTHISPEAACTDFGSFAGNFCTFLSDGESERLPSRSALDHFGGDPPTL
jgi:hypothetical protein